MSVRHLLALIAVNVVVWTAVFVPAAFTSDPAPSPTHTVAVFLDGINHFDFRAACSASDTHGRGMANCEQFYTFIEAQALMFGGTDTYTVIPHSARVWTQSYCQGRLRIPYPDGSQMVTCARETKIKLAVVKFKYGAGKGQVLHAHLRYTHGRWVVFHID